jgi:hypothetical protein
MARRCRTGKRRFDQLGAKIALAELKHRDHGEQRVYCCNHCSGWHLTSQPQRSERQTA